MSKDIFLNGIFERYFSGLKLIFLRLECVALDFVVRFWRFAKETNTLQTKMTITRVYTLPTSLKNPKKQQKCTIK